jgi:hypothetical protein
MHLAPCRDWLHPGDHVRDVGLVLTQSRTRIRATSDGREGRGRHPSREGLDRDVPDGHYFIHESIGWAQLGE